MSVSNGPNLGVMINALTGDSFDAAFRAFLRAIDVLLQGAVISKTLTAPPGSPANGDRYIVGASPTGAWAGQAKSIAVWTTDNPATPSGLWEFYPPKSGWLVYNIADSTFYNYSGSAWVSLGSSSAALATLTDVLLSSPANNDVLHYDSGTSKWKNFIPPWASAFLGLSDAPGSFSGAGGKAVEVNAGATALVFSAKPFDVGVTIPGVGTNNQVLIHLKLARAVTFPASATLSTAHGGTAATGSTTFTFKKNGTSFATVNFAASGTSGTFTQASDSVFAAGDLLELLGPATADATLADFGINLAGVRS
jgi:Protein of unknown function (DUF2793)